ncbi:hypothetical protein CI109_104993 [Kwoniella shandongensis]|uniref:Uncharacterized protein n=1 Tax=Kwoniella shandongensis TaxID=1734106 RepID=A0A5M6BQ13_9TREE|nr:uncharacterized protein CI109_006708 [Kwoniella shandongensis]KAA5524984.1 hypothetical protein CI109_006708 [Kwoniella shandongensis]
MLYRGLSILSITSLLTIYLIFLREESPGASLLSYPFSSRTRPTPVDILSTLSITPPGHQQYAWTEGDGSTSEFLTLGTPAHFIPFDDNQIIDVVTGQKLQGPTDGSTFNLGVLKLPRGSKWGFVGVARGPGRKRDLVMVNGYPSKEQVLIAFGLNITSEGKLHIVTPAQTIDIPMGPKQGCVPTKQFVGTYGAEDPRLFWTDAGTPGLVMARYTDALDTCRSLGFIPDLRDKFAPLADALAVGEGVVDYNAIPKVPGASNNLELIRLQGQANVEKNWVGFYPGAFADGVSLHPHVQYSFAPSLTLAPVDINARRILYNDIVPSPDLDTSECVSNAHFSWEKRKIHQASPLYRLTLCDRGPNCIAGVENTVLFGMAHTQKAPRHYGKFIATFNVSAPHNVISVGPRFQMTGLNDDQVNYVLTMAPIQESDLDPMVEPKQLLQPHLPSHFFLDDKMLITLGHEDKKMVNVMTTVREALGRQKICQRPIIDASLTSEFEAALGHQ